MAVVIRLQGLSITAGSEDIRSFFTGLKIPDGGVHIIGGELEEAFIIFASDEDARRAMTRSGGCIKGSPVNLLLSSKSEMQTVLEASAKRTELNKRMIKEGFRRPVMQAGGSPVFAENLSVEIRRMERYAMGGSSSSSAGLVSPSETYAHQARVVVPDGNDGLYMHLQGMPFSASKDDVRTFFRGLQVDDVILMKNHRGQNNGRGIVKFSTLRDANEGLRRDREYIGSRFVEVNLCTEQQWIEAGGQISPRVDGSGELARELCPAYGRKRLVQDRTRSRSPLAYRSKSPSPLVEEYYALVENLSYSVETRDIKGLFHPLALQDDQILHLHDRNRRRTRACFVLFRSLKDYCNGLSRNKKLLANRLTYITPLTKDKMMEMLESLGQKTGGFGGRSSRSVEKSQPRQPTYDSERICLYVRNLPFDVRKVEIKDFFQSFGVSENTVHLLYDEKGVGLGEALVTFRSEEETLRAESLNGQRFLGSEVMLKCISRVQMREFGVVNYQRRSPEASPRESSPERYAARLGEPSLFPLNGEHSDLQVPADAHISLREVPVGLRGEDPEPGSPVEGADGPGLRRLALPGQQFDGPTCLKLLNLPLKITIDEIYNFCYGYRVIPGSVSLQYNKNGVPKGSATVVFESRQEALTAVKELSGRPIGTRKVKVVFV